ncbi:MAG: hypothetical protein U9R50_12940 [Campylobacterota bacterium]|nr:hypothetical protein [Campylobacterota bacterium]
MQPISDILKYETPESIKKAITNHKKLATGINSLLSQNQINLLTQKDIEKLKET